MQSRSGHAAPAKRSHTLSEVGSGTSNGNHHWLPGTGSAMQALQRTVRDIAPTDIAVLLVGESGTGKDTLALHIHRMSARSAEPFVKISCATLSPELLHEHLREHAGGNGNPRESGLGGTVFLDEISELDAVCQPKLLQLLPDGDFAPIERTLGARVITATSRNLEDEVRQGRLREELFYRINAVCLRIPPLRQRREDIPSLLDYFLSKAASQFGRPRPTLRGETERLLLDYAWPGNVRELENAAKKIVALGDEALALDDLVGQRDPGEAEPARTDSGHGNGAGESISLKEAARLASRNAERELILKVLARTRWNRKRAAQELQISYKALLYKLKQIGVEESPAS